MFVSQLETPALIVDLDVLERNQTRVMDLLRPLGVALRPHYKSHKCTAIAHMQLAGGAKGITCAKLSEACLADDAADGVGGVISQTM